MLWMLSKARRLSVPGRSLTIGVVAMVAGSLLQGCGPSPAGSCATQTALPSSAVHTAAPPPRTYEALSQESDSGPLVLYGGESVQGPVLFDTWLWDGRTWSEHGQPSGPRVYWPLMTFDSAHDQIVLTGATTYDPTRATTSTQTWLWHGGSWQQAHPSTAPNSYSLDSSIAYDAANRRVVLYADIPKGYVATHEMWSWDGTNWTRVSLPHIVYYAAPRWIAPGPNGDIVGLGKNGQPDQKGVLYKWTGQDWKVLDVTGTPGSVRADAYDPVHRHLVVIGSSNAEIPDLPPPSDSTFTFDGHGWSATPLPAELRGRINPALTWYGGACALALWGGSQGHGNANLSAPQNYTDTWYAGEKGWVNVAR
jgi:hypothetical protein